MTYEEVAEKLGVRLCSGGCAYWKRDHERGWCDHTTIHWTTRQLRRHGLYRFLKMVVVLRMGLQEMPVGPEKLWMMSAGAYDLARSLGVRLPREILAQDRTVVRSWLVAHGNDMDEDTRKKITRWAR